MPNADTNFYTLICQENFLKYSLSAQQMNRRPFALLTQVVIDHERLKILNPCFTNFLTTIM